MSFAELGSVDQQQEIEIHGERTQAPSIFKADKRIVQVRLDGVRTLCRWDLRNRSGDGVKNGG